ncbi:MAG: restriction endonuclease subunit S, partial [Dolichospermum sp.]
MVILRADESKIYPYYLYLYLRSSIFKKQILKNTSGSAQPQLPIGNLHNVIISYPEISIQKKIAAVLSSLHDKIELNNRINSELENLAKTIYDYWFVQFDFPDENGKPYKSCGGKMV